MSNLEIASNIFNVVSVFLARKNNIHTWWTGIIACILFGILFFNSNLYADSLLQLFFIGTSVMGWRNWKSGSQQSTELPITRTNIKSLILIITISLFLTIIHGLLLRTFTNGSYPFIDSSILMLSITAQILLMGRKIENWYFWIVVNTISVPLYFIKDLKLTSFIYLIFLINAVWGLKAWKKILKSNEKI
jgi:nicotinamide mononucleotide transporter